ncbi:MAG: HDIG domain-containing metalloprotein [bacterium]
MKLIKSIISFFTGLKRLKEKPFSVKEERGWFRWVIGGVLVLLLALMFPRSRSLQFADMKEGSISTRRIVAPFNFEILKTNDEYRRDREIATQKVYPIFSRNATRIDEVNERLESFFKEIGDARNRVSQKPDIVKILSDSLFRRYPIGFPNDEYRNLMVNPRGRLGDGDLQSFQNTVKKIIRDVMAIGVLETEKDGLTVPDRRLIISEHDEEAIRSIDDFYDLNEARVKAAEFLNADYANRVYLPQIGFGIVSFFLRPNLIYEEAIHQQRIDDAVARVPLSSGFVYENEKIVDRNERITPEIRKKLISFATKMAEMGMQERGIERFFPFVGRVVFVLSLLFILVAFIRLGHPEVLKDTKMVLLVALVILLVGLLTFLIHRLDASEYLVPTALGAMLLAVLIDSSMGFWGAAVISVLVGGIWGNDFNLMVVSFFVGVVGVLTIKSIRDRRQLIQAILYLVGATLFAITFMGFLRFLPFREIVKQWPYGALTGLITPIMTYGLMPLVESVFNITTDFSLLELSNLNHPLLKRLSVEASGTYHHSIIVGNLSEAAAQAVGANSLLARVGSYYHDVGKIEKAEYFVENQVRGENPHEKLTPRMSALILMNHVKRGLELSEKYKLPLSIKNIIAQHQGTAVMSFFYQKAVRKNGGEEAREEDYRYPGPRPQTKEAAIVMLADAVEAAARSLKDPTHSRLKGLIEDLVDGRFKEGQLDESPLTLRDLERIKEAFLMILAGTFHTRIEYPEMDEQKSSNRIKKKRESLAED